MAPASGSSDRPYYGRTIVAASFCMQAVAVGALVTYGVFFKYLQADFGWSRAFISGASSVAMLLMGTMGMVFGRLNDRLGPRVILLISGLMLGGGYLLMSSIGAGWQLYVFYGLFVGVGMSTHDIVTLSTVARWYRRKRGLMTGLVKAGTGTGQFTVPLIVSSLILAYGYRNAYMMIGAAIIVVYVLASRLLRRSPEEMGLRPDGESDVANDHLSSAGLTLEQAVRTRQFWFCCVSYFCVIFGTMTILVHVVPHASDIGMVDTQAAAVVSIIGLVSIAGRVTMGNAGDRIGSRRTFLLCFGVLFVALTLLQIADRAWMMFVFGIIYGFAHGGFYTVLSPTVAELFGLKAHGAIFGVVYFWGTLGGAVGPVVAGRIFDIQQSYGTAFMLLLVLAFLAWLLMLRVRPLTVA